MGVKVYVLQNVNGPSVILQLNITNPVVCVCSCCVRWVGTTSVNPTGGRVLGGGNLIKSWAALDRNVIHVIQRCQWPYLRERTPVVPSPSVYHQRFMRYGHPKVSPHPHGLHRTCAVRLPRRLPASYAKAPLGVRAYIAPCFDWKCHHPFFWHSTRDSNCGG